MKMLKNNLTKNVRTKLKVGEEILYSGVLYTARDQAHKRLVESLRKGRKLPIRLKDIIIY